MVEQQVTKVTGCQFLLITWACGHKCFFYQLGTVLLLFLQMAKSLRSKRRRKMRSIKREKYGKKELERLKGILDKAKDQDVEMKDLYTGKLDNLVLLFFFLVHTSALFDPPEPSCGPSAIRGTIPEGCSDNRFNSKVTFFCRSAEQRAYREILVLLIVQHPL